MPKIELTPTIEHLAQEYLLVPAWKKSHDYIRHQNWYSDVLELDLTNTNLADVMWSLAQEISSDNPIVPTPLRLVLAPKSQPWEIANDQWRPVGGPSSVSRKLRPLAHICVRDQIIATGFMILLADVVENRQGDPRRSAREAHNEKMVSYGHRLFCDEVQGQLRFRWGNAGVYRRFYQDYQSFIARPGQIVADQFDSADDSWAIVSVDLSQFYDRVRPDVLHDKVKSLLGGNADETFLRKFRELFNWKWYSTEEAEALNYAETTEPTPISDFDQIALPQGLVASGFFSNAVLLDFDDAVIRCFEEWRDSDDWKLVDYCRYVDDMRFVVRLGARLTAIEKHVALEKDLVRLVEGFVTNTLAQHAPGLVVNPSKCEVVLGRNAGAGSIRLSSSMRRINHNTSGVMDLFVGEETLEMIETLLYSSEAGSVGFENRFQDTILAAKPDVRDTTVARFAANRFRRAYRTLRPMVDPADESDILSDDDASNDESDDWNVGRFQLGATLNRDALDQKAYHFSSRLVEKWIRDPSNMRLLRVALDLNPESKTLTTVLELLNEYVGVKKKHKAPRRIAWYCAAELLKAGATETGLVDDDDKLPTQVDLKAYQLALADLAYDVVGRKAAFPWYVVQQAYLYLACFGKYLDDRRTSNAKLALRSYVLLHKALNDRYHEIPYQNVPHFVLLHANLRSPADAASSFVKRLVSEGPIRQRRWLTTILSENRMLAQAVWNEFSKNQRDTWGELYASYGIIESAGFPASARDAESDKSYSLLDVACSQNNPFQQEYLALHFASKLLQTLQGQEETITPNRVFVRCKDWTRLLSDSFPIATDDFSIEIVEIAPCDVRFRLPSWVKNEDGWKYQLGMLLRVLLTGLPDYTLDARSFNSRSNVVYSPHRSSWLRRRYGMFNGRTAFGPPWTPISTWFGSLLNKLLEWPGFPDHEFEVTLPEDFDAEALQTLLRSRIVLLESLYGRGSQTPILPIRVPKHSARRNMRKQTDSSKHRMRVGVAQTVLPRFSDFSTSDLQLIGSHIRRKHRRHTAAVLAGIQRMLEVRTTHEESITGIELLILPELSIHPLDIKPILIPFAKQNRCLVCAGMVFQPCHDPEKLMNSAVWLIPRRKPSGGLDVETVFQGKQNMTTIEEGFGIQPFRPAQWLLELVDSATSTKPLLAMTGAVCYDATDISLAADIREHSDLFVIPALNRDVGTFDNMAAALHYHMFQHVIVANSGEFGGSSAQAPFEKNFLRTIFHTHGNNQVGISFFEVDVSMYRNGNNGLKTPPANHRRARQMNGEAR